MNDVITSLAVATTYDQKLIDAVLGLPHKMLQHHEAHALPHMVLHELAHANNLDLKRAGYFIDSPSFDCLRGVAGFSREECALHADDIWHDAASFEKVMQDAAFHKAVSAVKRASLRRNFIDPTHMQDIIAFGKELGMENPKAHVWNLRHGNHGILLYEEGEKKIGDAVHAPIFDSVTGLLGLCHA